MSLDRVGRRLLPAVLWCAVAAWPQTAAPPDLAPGVPKAASAPTGATAQPAGAPAQSAAGSEEKPQPYRTLNTGQKFDVFLRYTYSPYILIVTVFDSAIAQASGDWYSYGGGMEGYGKRFGATLANNESGAFFGRFLFPAIFHQDPRYLRLGQGGTKHRMGYAASRVLVTRSDSGNKVFNISLVASTLAGASLANAYYPREERGLGDTMGRTGSGLASHAGVNILREFWPEIRGKFKKHEPESVKRLEKKLPIEKVEKVMTEPGSESDSSAKPQHQPEAGSSSKSEGSAKPETPPKSK